MTDTTDTDSLDTSQEEPLFTVRYLVSSSTLKQAASVLAGPQARNPGYVFSAVLLAIMVFVLVTNNATDRQLTFGICVAVLAAIFWAIGSKWQDIQLKRLRNHGFATVDTKGTTKRQLVVFDDKLVSTDPEGTESRYLTSEVKRVRSDSQTCVVQLADKGFLVLPREDMTDSRYTSLVAFLEGLR
ncbi:MAG: hypothetical protein PHR15_04860 [Atopobiaceae bacterium]|jgi:hypothetical protein|nr:hypothetical protein [Atopobiaceae bacterium]MCH4214847.1 hypothetical protein [Atopobiaceae bacterium]MCH4230093.1 hypothetical protein [Atopobiaceae bacterium]MCH4276969.1 hypothetical protein [Atopobiaceae bacterium]MCI1226911.1 hypothetical protein [Atopobiaceae bacterium]